MKLRFPREVLLVEIERRCGDAACNARVFVGLTKDEARAYTGFVCERCERWTDDALAERDIPDWWEELRVASLEGLRPARTSDEEEPGEVVARMSEAWRRVGAGEASAGEGEDEGEDGGAF